MVAVWAVEAVELGVVVVWKVAFVRLLAFHPESDEKARLLPSKGRCKKLMPSKYILRVAGKSIEHLILSLDVLLSMAV